MSTNKAVAGGAVGLLAGASDGLTPLIRWACMQLGLPDEVCAPLAGWLGPAFSAVLGGLLVYAIPNKG